MSEIEMLKSRTKHFGLQLIIRTQPKMILVVIALQNLKMKKNLSLQWEKSQSIEVSSLD